MPRDSNGVYSLPAGYEAEQGETILPSQHNPPLEDIATALTGSLPVSGSAPMTGVLRVVDGTSSAPGIAFASDPTKGFYLDASGNIVPTAPLLGTFPVGFGPLPWSGYTAPPGWVLCYGQALSRTTYAALWAFAQTEIAAGNAFYGNGDGSTTFTIGDMRGRVPGGRDTMGGSNAGRLDPTITSDIIGSTGGSQTRTLSTSNLPPYTPAGTIANGAISTTLSPSSLMTGQGSLASGGPGSAQGLGTVTASSTQNPSSFTGTAQGGSSTPFAIVQPTLITSYILFAGA